MIEYNLMHVSFRFSEVYFSSKVLFFKDVYLYSFNLILLYYTEYNIELQFLYESIIFSLRKNKNRYQL